MKCKRSEGGSGGKRGHSNMTHWDTTANVKDGARRARRQDDAREVNLITGEMADCVCGNAYCAGGCDDD